MTQMKALLLVVVLAGAVSQAGAVQTTCATTECAAGDTAVTYATKSEPYYACPTRQLASYTNFVLGLLAMHAMLGGKMPNISDKTGEPEYPDSGSKPNETRLMLDVLRREAGVSTFDQAVARCVLGRGGQRVTIMNNPKDEVVAWVSTDKQKATFWMPKSSLNRR